MAALLGFAATPLSPLMTYADYLTLPDDGNRYEILDGELAVTPSPTFRHQKIAQRLNNVLYTALELTGHGDVIFAPMDVILDGHTVLQPDLIFIAQGRLVLTDERIGVAPDLVVEILSASTRRRDVLTKARIYARHGVPHYWLIDPDIDRIEFMGLTDGTYTLIDVANAPAVIEAPGFAGVVLDLAALFAL